MDNLKRTFARVRLEAWDRIEAGVGTLKAESKTLRAEMAALKEQVVAAPGKVPIAKAWEAESYAGAFVSHADSTWQAKRDTAKRPGDSDDWLLIARAGRDGRNGQDARSMSFKGWRRSSPAREGADTQRGSQAAAGRYDPRTSLSRCRGLSAQPCNTKGHSE
jgi:hypothetical protein